MLWKLSTESGVITINCLLAWIYGRALFAVDLMSKQMTEKNLRKGGN